MKKKLSVNEKKDRYSNNTLEHLDSDQNPFKVVVNASDLQINP